MPILAIFSARHLVDALAHEFDRAVGDLTVLVVEQAGDRLEGGALAGAVGPQQGHDAAFGDLDGNAFDHEDDLVVFDLDVVDLQDHVLGQTNL